MGACKQRADPEPCPEWPRSLSMLPQSPASPGAARRRILCVDDNKFARGAIAHTLARAGYQVDSAADGREALQIIGAAGDLYHALLTDHEMPYLGGLGLVRGVREMNLKLEVIVVSSRIEDEEARQYELLGVRKILEKPLMPIDIQSAVDALFEG